MFNVNTLLFVGIAALAVLSVAPVAVPLIETLLDSMKLVPRRY